MLVLIVVITNITNISTTVIVLSTNDMMRITKPAAPRGRAEGSRCRPRSIWARPVFNVVNNVAITIIISVSTIIDIIISNIFVSSMPRTPEERPDCMPLDR